MPILIKSLNSEVHLTARCAYLKIPRSKYACAVAGIFKGRVQLLDHLRAARCCTSNGSKWHSLLKKAWELTVAIVVSTIKIERLSPELASKHAKYRGQGTHTVFSLKRGSMARHCSMKCNEPHLLTSIKYAHVHEQSINQQGFTRAAMCTFISLPLALSWASKGLQCQFGQRYLELFSIHFSFSNRSREAWYGYTVWAS